MSSFVLKDENTLSDPLTIRIINKIMMKTEQSIRVKCASVF